MDLATLIGVISGLALIIGSIVIGSPLGFFIDIPSVMITVGGMLAATLIHFPLRKVIPLFGIVKKTLFFRLPAPEREIRRLVSYANIARREGLLALEEKLEEVNDPFCAKGIRLVIDGFPAETVRDILSIDTQFLHERHMTGKKILDYMSIAAPAFGMIGTLIGLIQMLQKLNDPSQIGSGMAVALITTFYGAILANLIFIPLAGKLELRDKEEALMRDIVVEGVLSIQAGDKPQLVEEKLKSFVSPGTRRRLEEVAA
ncbi:MAG: MotA/TolQ/ExbB proton channel family protein [Planctomycetota bacterium]